MFTRQQYLFSTFSILLALSQQSLAIGDAVSKIAGNISDTAGKVGNSIGDTVGIGSKASDIDRNVDDALKKLYSTTPAAVKLAKSAKAILVYPKILKAGIGIGGHHGEGALRKQGKTVAYYNTVAGSYGLQIGAQSFGYAMFFMNEKALKYLNKSEGWEVGVGPSIVLVDEGLAKSMTSTTTTEDVYVFTFNQAGLMAGAGIQGSKITKLTPKK